MKQLLLILFSFLFLTNFGFAQKIAGTDIRLAYQYYQNKDYDKAEVLFKKISESTTAKVYYSYYINCLVEQGKFDIAEKSVKKQIRNHKNDPSYYVDLGWVYKRENRFDESKKYYEKALKRVQNYSQAVRSLASAFMQRREYEYAEKTYLKGRKITNDDFRSELANLYAVQRNFKKMINEYLDWLQVSGRNLPTVENRMQYFIDKDINEEFSTVLRTELLKRIQKSNSGIVFNRMLVWYFLQRKEFSQALIQATAIDKRLNTSGKQILDLAETAKSNKDYVTATNAYDYVIKKGRNRPFFIEANVGKLNVSYLKIINGDVVSEEAVNELEKEYLQTLKSLGIGFNTIQSVIDLAHLKTFYLDKPKEAEDLLSDALELQGLDKRLAARCEIELGDVLVYENNLDYAALIYAKAEMENKGNLFGDMAKLKKAKLAYYAQNFRWAKAQFDALKESTSKPVANDALYYSLLIDDNTEDDSLQIGMKLFAQAELYVFRNKKDSALMITDTLLKKLPGHQITDDTYFLKAEIYASEKNFKEAEKYYKKIITEYAFDILADRAMFDLAVMYEEQLNDKEQAAEYYKRLMLEHPDSIFVTEARRRFRKIRRELSEEEFMHNG